MSQQQPQPAPFNPQGPGPFQPQPAPFYPQGPGQFQPQPPLPPKKPWFKKWWVWLLALVVVIGIGNSLGSGGTSDTAARPAQQVSDAAASGKKDAPASQKAEAPASQKAEAPASQKAEAPAAPKERLTLEEGWKIDKSNPYAKFVTGYVKNNSDKAINNYAQITFDALDKDGANVGTCMDNTNTIDANGKWKFKATCFDTDGEIAKVRFKEITGY